MPKLVRSQSDRHCSVGWNWFHREFSSDLSLTTIRLFVRTLFGGCHGEELLNFVRVTIINSTTDRDPQEQKQTNNCGDNNNDNDKLGLQHRERVNLVHSRFKFA